MRNVAALTAVVALCTVMVQGRQSPAATSRVILQQIGLPAMDRGLRDQDPPRAARARGDAERVTKTGGPRLPYEPGSIVVKYKNDPDAFDVVAIPTSADPEAMAAAMASRPDVEFAQPRYRNYATSRPNDTLYPNQWNFPAIDMERAWDIQPGATSDIIVAVLDSGMAFRSITIAYNDVGPFELDGRRYPALGDVIVPFAAAPELGTSGSSRFVAPRDFIWNDDLPVDLDGHGTHV